MIRAMKHRYPRAASILPFHTRPAPPSSTRNRPLPHAGRRWATLGLLVAFLGVGAGVRGAESSLGPDGDVLRATLKNGLRVVVVRSPLAPVAAVEVNYLAGSNEAPKGFPGMAHAQEHMMFRGSPGLSSAQLAYLNAVMGGMANADTQQTVTQYFNTVPAKDLEVALRIEAVRMRGVSDSEHSWDQERGAINQEVAQDLSSPDYVLYTKVLAALFRGTPYAHDALGTRESFDKTRGAMLKAFHERWYAPNNAILVIVGDVDSRNVLRQVQELFGSIPAKKIRERPSVRLRPVRPETFHLKTDRANGMVVVAFRLPGYDSSDYPAARLLADVLDSQRGDLYALVADGKALSSSVEADFLPHAGLGYAAVEFPKGGNPAPLLKEVEGILARYAEQGLPQDLVLAAKRREVTELELQRNSIPDLAMAWSQALAVEGRQSPQDDIDLMNRVSVKDVDRVARKYVDLSAAVRAILTPEPSGKAVAGQGFGGAESFTPEETKAVELPAWAKNVVGSLSVPASNVHPVQETLPNGLRLIIQSASTSDTVSVYGRVRNEPALQTPPGQEGVSEVLSGMFSYGTTTLDRLAFQRALDEIGVDESAGTSFSVLALSGHFERAVELLADNELHPALQESAFRIVRKQVADRVAGQLQSPRYLTRRALTKALYPQGDPKLRQATPKTVNGLSLEDIRRYYGRVYRPDMTTIVVIGKIDPDRAKTVLAKYFGAWKAEGPKPQTDLPPVPPNQPSVTAVPDKSRVQDRVILAQTLGMNRFDPDYYALQLGDHVLGGGFYATRLYQDLRERKGLVYSVGTAVDAGRTRALYMVEYACDPKNVSRARAIVERDLRDMQSAPVSAHMLRQAKGLLLTEIALAEASLAEIADRLLSRATVGLPLDEPTVAARRYVSLTSQEVKAVFARRLRVTDLVQVTQGPTPH
jgi:zinc protease